MIDEDGTGLRESDLTMRRTTTNPVSSPLACLSNALLRWRNTWWYDIKENMNTSHSMPNENGMCV